MSYYSPMVGSIGGVGSVYGGGLTQSYAAPGFSGYSGYGYNLGAYQSCSPCCSPVGPCYPFAECCSLCTASSCCMCCR